MNNVDLTADQIQYLVDLVNQKFPGWKGFADPEFEKEEVTYKQVAVQKAKELLNETDLKYLISRKSLRNLRTG